MYQKTLYTALFVVLSLWTSSCITIKPSNNGYVYLPEVWKNIVVEYENTDLIKREEIYKINGAQLRTRLVDSNKSLVYIIDNKTQEIASLVKLENTMKAHNVDLILVMQNYEFAYLTFNQRMYSPVFVIDNEFYNKKALRVYKGYFVNHMLGNEKLDTKLEPSYLYYFEGGQLIDSGDYSLLKRNGF